MILILVIYQKIICAMNVKKTFFLNFVEIVIYFCAINVEFRKNMKITKIWM